jgi:hypothetical protein
MKTNITEPSRGANRAAAARASRRQRLDRAAALKPGLRAAEGPKEIATFNGRAALRVTEFCKALGISKSKGYAMIKDGALKTVDIAGMQMIPAHVLALLVGEGVANG